MSKAMASFVLIGFLLSAIACSGSKTTTATTWQTTSSGSVTNTTSGSTSLMATTIGTTPPIRTGLPTPVSAFVGSLPTNGRQAPDDIVATPGGFAYRANVYQQGIPDKWPPVETLETRLVSGSEAIFVRYRNNITTKPGEIRNNILNVRKENGLFEQQPIKLYTVGAPSGVKLLQAAGVGLPGTISTILLIEVPQDLNSGRYDFYVGIEMEGRDYGTLPCTIEVTR